MFTTHHAIESQATQSKHGGTKYEYVEVDDFSDFGSLFFIGCLFFTMDRTILFKASVKTIRTRNKALGVKDIDKGSAIFASRSKVETEFGNRAKDVVRICFYF